MRGLLAAWLGLLAILAAEIGAALLPIAHAFRPLLLLPALAMVAIVALVLMRLGRSTVLVRGFAVMAVFWLIVLLCLGSLDAMTRTLYPV